MSKENNPRTITATKQVNDRVNRTVSPSKCIILPPRVAIMSRGNQNGTYGTSAFLQRVQADTPENEANIRGTRDLEGVEVSVEASLAYFSDLGLKIITEDQVRRHLESRGATVVD